jgi:hypothetical protein
MATKDTHLVLWSTRATPGLAASYWIKWRVLGPAARYMAWFRACISYRSAVVHVLGKLFSPFVMLSRLPQSSTLGSLLLNMFITIHIKIYHSIFLLFADSLNIYRVKMSVQDFRCSQTDINAVYKSGVSKITWTSKCRNLVLFTFLVRLILFILTTTLVKFKFWLPNM